jgi:hypothetical protein
MHRLHAGVADFVPSALRFCRPQPVDSPKLARNKALDQEVREAGAPGDRVLTTKEHTKSTKREGGKGLPEPRSLFFVSFAPFGV